MSYPDSIKALERALSEAELSPVTSLANRLIEGAKSYDNYRVKSVLDSQDYEGGIKRNFISATEHTADNVLGAPWADDADAPLEKHGEVWNKGRRASLTGAKYEIDAMGRPINPYLKTGVQGRGVIGLFGPNHAVDVGALTIKDDAQGKKALHAYGIMKGGRAAFCGGFVEYDTKDENGFVMSRDTLIANQVKEFFEEMVSGSITLQAPYAVRVEQEFKNEIDTRVANRGGKAIDDKQANIIHAQIETGLKLEQVEACDPEFMLRLRDVFNDSRECYAGPVRSTTRNTDTSWMETYLSWVIMDESRWDYIKGNKPAFNYALAAGDDADDVVAHRIDQKLMESATGTHSAMFALMAASYLLESQKLRWGVDADVMSQLETLSDFLNGFKPSLGLELDLGLGV